jgi:glycosyltransferase involved in cell wall biosynthesis
VAPKPTPFDPARAHGTGRKRTGARSPGKTDVTPALAGVHLRTCSLVRTDSGFRRNDGIETAGSSSILYLYCSMQLVRRKGQPENQRPLNVLWAIDHVCYDGNLHGGGRLYWNVLPNFDPDRCRVTACMLRATPEIRRVFSESAHPVRVLGRSKFDPTTLLDFLRLIREEEIDVLHLHCYGASTFGRLAGLLTGVPTVIHDYDTEVYFPYPWYLSAADRWLARSTGRALAASPMVRSFQVRKRKIDPDRIETVFHAVPDETFLPPSAQSILEVRAMLGAQPETPIVGAITKLGPERGNEHFLRAAARVLEKRPETLFVLAYNPTIYHRAPSKEYVPDSATNDALNGTDLRRLAEDLGITSRLRLIEHPRDLRPLLSSFSLFVAPFLSERFSSVHLVEALAAGVPVIATELGDQLEIVRSGFNGHLVPPGDVEQLARTIEDLLRDSVTRERLGRQAAADARRYSVQGCAARLEELYIELAGRREASVALAETG